ncbi:hypothetical protein SHKM778_56710 [Streptomyces sp. KM77-8]|uniref:ABC transporter domain-containing protein n=1 Tax=Streptomyces haneummycinicus TaxID=3074435 RepID=A0AAT9HPJ5_9ACTN
MILVGPSGCGKSTTLNMIAGLEDITEGTLRIGGRVVNDLALKERDVAMVFQSYALYPHMSVRENMGFPLRLAKVDKQVVDSKVEEAARVLDLGGFLDRKPANLSGGQRQRVAMGRAIVRDPKAFLMDEPLSNLDAKLRVQMRTQISRLQRRLGTTTVYVTHDQTEAMTLGDRVVVMRQGLVQQVGSPAQLYDTPRNLFVAGFIGSPAMNFLHASLSGGALRTRSATCPSTTVRSGRSRSATRPARSSSDCAPRPSRTRAWHTGRAAPSSPPPWTCWSRWAPTRTSTSVPRRPGDDGRTGGTRHGLRRTRHRGRGGQQIVARLNAATRAREGAPVELRVDMGRAHVFDPSTGRNLTHPERH